MATAYPIQDPNDLILQMQTEINGQPLRTVLPRTRAMLTTNVQPAAAAPRNPIEGYRSRAAELYGQGSELYNREPDMSAIEAYARQRGASGNAAMLNALAAQFAGEQFQPVQAQYLKRAAAAQDPIKFGSGMMTPDGKFIRDPEAMQNKRAEFLMQQARAYEQLAQTAQSAQERAQALAMQNQIANEMRMLGLQIQADRAGQGSYDYAGTTPEGLPVNLNKKTGQFTDAMGRAVTGSFTPKGSDKTTEGERTAAGYLSRMRAAENILGSIPLESQSPGMVERTAQYMPGEFGMDVANLIRDPLRKRAYQAQSDWVRAKLRKESGAVIGPQEMRDEIRTYFPMPGEDDETIRQKAASRKQAERQFEISAGNAASQAAPSAPSNSDPLGIRKQ